MLFACSQLSIIIEKHTSYNPQLKSQWYHFQYHSPAKSPVFRQQHSTILQTLYTTLNKRNCIKRIKDSAAPQIRYNEKDNTMNANTIKNDIRIRYDQLTNLIDTAEAKLKKLPSGMVRIKTYNDKVYYFKANSSGGNFGERIRPDEVQQAGQLAQSTYLKRIISCARRERTAIGNFIKRYPDIAPEDIYTTLSPQRRALVDPVYLPDDEYIRRWLDVPYEPKGFLETDPFFITSNKERVRSKSEQIIAERLSSAGIPYRYECPVNINSKTFYPDFTILKQSNRKVIYLEHFGMMDNPDYANNATKKINAYSNGGLIAGKNLFMTFETSRNPLDIRALNNLIDSVFK